MSQNHLLSLSGQSHLITKCAVSSELDVPFGWMVRLLVLWPLGHPELAVPYWPLFNYMKAYWTRSDAWQRVACRAVGLFWDYCQVRIPLLNPSEPILKQHRDLLQGFGSALLDGTIYKLSDPLELYWPSQGVDVAGQLVTAMETFAKWLFAENGKPNPLAINPTTCERMFNSIVAVTRQGQSLLGYLGNSCGSRSLYVQLPPGDKQGNALLANPLSFPASQVENVLWNGFKRRRGNPTIPFGQYNIRPMMIFLLQNYAGLREHEPFHIWVTDVVEDPQNPGSASVFLYHPVKGLAFIEGVDGCPIRTTRLLKLRHDYDLTPRTLGTGSYRIGWKSSLVEGKDFYSCLHWTDPLAAQTFWELYNAYLLEREMAMKRRRALGYRDHPFLFVSTEANPNSPEGTSAIGAPAGIAQYERALQRAVTRLGMVSSKENGTTSQAARHLYANTLKRQGQGPKLIQLCLRHHDIKSQERYGRLTPSQVNEALRSVSVSYPDVSVRRTSLETTLSDITRRFPPHAAKAL
ncbi:hypothetical protein B0G80_2444 [Paraburkholderia sp. BL6669N2]|uniref:hypothetical protein n=1 Tax=Paraburkholderia sp. BL6669N2 TaxID=1938807 RepID=UPI000E388625|nr:hypothetical protein [Paraburkholderia sp. BL6669N2]REG59673.1 hypothetical protein B0G80_2444 [Paraburkholderia sp. BL6669N2]